MARQPVNRPVKNAVALVDVPRRQVPLEDFYLLLEHGDPKAIRLFPGGHMGSIPNIFNTVLAWLHEKLD